MNKDKAPRHVQPDGDESLALAKEIQAQRRQRQAKYLRQQMRILRTSTLTSQEPLYWPLRKTG